MENTQDLEIDIDDIGTILKSSRLKQKKSMEEISNELCIRKIYLTALEEGDYETLPPIPYGVGYVRTYARYLGLNPERAVKLYKTASTVEEEKEDEVKEVLEVNKSGSKHIVVGIVALFLVYAGWSWYINTVETALPESTQEDTFIEDEMPASETVDEPIVNQAEPKELNTENNQATAVPTNEVSQDIIEEKPELPTEKPAVVENNKVSIEFTGESWVELKDKNKVYFQGVFHKGDKKEVDYTDNLFLSVGRPHNVTVYIKGDKKNILIKRRKMNIPLDSLD